MNVPEPRLPDYLDHILEAIDRIQEYVEDIAEPEFLTNTLIQDAVIRNLEVIGEASKNIERRHPAFANQHPEIPWAIIYAMRNRMAHGYFKVDLEIVWRTIEIDLPEIEKSLKIMREKIG